MISFVGFAKGKPMYGIGLSDKDVAYLKQQDEPMVVDLAELGGDGRIAIFYGEDDKSMAAELQPFAGKEVVT